MSANALVFIPRKPIELITSNIFLSNAQARLSRREFNLLCTVAQEWHSQATLESCISYWQQFARNDTTSSFSHLHVLCFNVRGLERRWNEVVLLCSIYSPDILVLLEVGQIDHTLIAACFDNFRSFYQPGKITTEGLLSWWDRVSVYQDSRAHCPTYVFWILMWTLRSELSECMPHKARHGTGLIYHISSHPTAWPWEISMST